jgi:DNA-binding NtrC family response regulator
MDLEALVRQGRFREDLYYRINTVHIALPALRDRQEDIVPLAERFLKRFAEKYHRPLTVIAPEAAELLKAQRWSGNIRELQNCVEKAVILSEGTVLTVKDLQIDARSGSGMTGNRSGMTGNGSGMTEIVTPGLTGGLPCGGAEEERLVREAMERAGGNISAAAKALGVSRPTLYAKLKKYDI